MSQFSQPWISPFISCINFNNSKPLISKKKNRQNKLYFSLKDYIVFFIYSRSLTRKKALNLQRYIIRCQFMNWWEFQAAYFITIRKIINDKDKSYNLYFYANKHFIFFWIKFEFKLKSIENHYDWIRCWGICNGNLSSTVFWIIAKNVFILLILNEILHMKEFSWKLSSLKLFGIY